MFKNATLLKIKGFETFDPMTNTFMPCSSSQGISAGWAPPRGEHQDLIERIYGQAIFMLCIERKSVPAQAVNDAVAKKIKEIEEATGRRPGKKEARAILDDERQRLLASAFPRRTNILAWFDPRTSILAIDTVSQRDIDIFVTELVRSSDGAVVHPIQTRRSPVEFMTAAVMAPREDAAQNDGPLAIGRAAELRSEDGEGATVRVRGVVLDEKTVSYIRSGMTVRRLSLNFVGRVQFALDASLRLRGIKFLDGVFGKEEPVDAFDANVVILTEVLRPLISVLLNDLGGELVEQPQAIPA